MKTRKLLIKVAVGIVLFHPDYERLKQCIFKIQSQIECLILFNNGTMDDELISLCNDCEGKIIVLGNGKNIGIAAALNAIMEFAYNNSYEWVLTLDQDSIIPDNLIKIFSQYMIEDDVAIICSQNIDFRRKYMKPIMEPKSENVTMCDTSGSCVRLSIWKELNGFDDWLFIDLVDNDYCKRVILSGYRIVRVNKVILDHRYGIIEKRNKYLEKILLKCGEITNNINISKLSFKRKVNPLRMYYENRNILYLNKKYQKYGGIGYSNHHCKTYMGFFLTFSVYSFLVSDKKKETIFAIIRGIRDGKKEKVTPWELKDTKSRKRLV